MQIAGLVCLPFIFGVLNIIIADLPMREASNQTPLFAWGARDWPVLARGLYLGLFGNIWLAICAVAVGVLAILQHRNLRVYGLLPWALGLMVPAVFLLFSGVNRVQPAYASYAVPLCFLGLGYLAKGMGRRLGEVSLSVVLFALAFQLSSLFSSLAAPAPIPDPARVMADELQARQQEFSQVLSVSHDLMVPIRLYLEDMSQPVSPLGTVKDELEGFSGVRVRNTSATDLRIYTLFIRHNIPSNVRDMHRRAVAELRRQGGVSVLYDKRVPNPEIYTDLWEGCDAPTSQPPYALFRCPRSN